MRRLVVVLVIAALLASACSFTSDADPGTADPNPGEPLDPSGPGPNDPSRTDDEDDDDNPEPVQAQIIWETDSPPSTYKDILAGNTLLYIAVDSITAQDMDTGAILWSRDLAHDGFELSDMLMYDTPPLLDDTTLSYPLRKGGKVYIEQIDTASGELLWRLEIGREGEVSYQWEGELLKVASGPYECSYYQVSSGQYISCLEGTSAYCHQGAYYTFSQESFAIAKYAAAGQELWVTAIEAEMNYPYLGEIWSQGNTVLFNLADYNGATVQYLTVAVSAQTGEIVWTKTGFRAESRDDAVILLTEGKITVVETATGQEIQEILTDADADTVTFIWQGFLYMTSRTTLQKIDLSSGETVWNQPMPGRIDLYYGVTPEDNLRDMSVLWALLEETTDPVDYLVEQLVAIDPASGDIISVFPFTVPFGGPESWPVKLTRDGQDKTYIVLERNAHEELSDHSMLLIDAHSGQELWEYEYPESCSDIDILFSQGSNLVVVLRSSAQEVEIIYMAKETGNQQHCFLAAGYPSLMIGDRILMNISGNKTVMIAPPQ